jgi:hypothetical protein
MHCGKSTTSRNVDYDLVLAIVLGIMWKQFFYKTSTINDLNNDVVEGD